MAKTSQELEAALTASANKMQQVHKLAADRAFKKDRAEPGDPTRTITPGPVTPLPVVKP